MRMMGEDSESAAPAVLRLAARSDGHRRASCREALVRMHPKVMPHLVEALASAKPAMRRAAAEALGELGDRAVEAAGALRKAAEDTDAAVRAAARAALARVAPEGDPAEALVAEMATKRSFDRFRLMGRLAAMGKKAVPALIRALSNREIEDQVVTVLGRIGPDAHAAVPALVDKMRDAGLRWEILQAIAAIGRDAVPHLMKALESEQTLHRLNAARALGHLGPMARFAVDALEKARKDDDERVVKMASSALASIRGR